MRTRMSMRILEMQGQYALPTIKIGVNGEGKTEMLRKKRNAILMNRHRYARTQIYV